jgi:anti-sigma B factor antagonist
MSETFELVVTVLEDEAVISVVGELDFHTAPRLREEIIKLLNQGVLKLIVDLSQMQFVDSSGLGVLVAGLKRMRERDGNLTLRSPSANTSQVLEVSGLNKLLLVS